MILILVFIYILYVASKNRKVGKQIFTDTPVYEMEKLEKVKEPKVKKPRVKKNFFKVIGINIKNFFVKGEQEESGFRRYIKSDGFKNIVSSLICVVFGLLIGFVVIVIVNAQNAGVAITSILKGGFNAPRWTRGLGAVIVNATPLLLCSLSIIFAYKCGLFNIGAPGQYVMGILFAFFGAYLLKAPWYVCVVMAAIGGALWGMIPGFFKAFLNINEVITSIMFNWIGLYILNYFAGPEFGKMYNILLAECRELPHTAKLPTLGMENIFGGYKYVTVAVFIAIALAIVILVILNKTKFGYEIKATGFNKDAAKYAGMNHKRNILITMAIAGALAGVAAACFYLTGYEIYSATKQTALPPMGFNGIAVAFLGCLNPIGAIFASLFITHINVGGGYLDTTFYSSEIANLISSIIIYLCAFSLFIKTILSKIKIGKKANKGGEK